MFSPYVGYGAFVYKRTLLAPGIAKVGEQVGQAVFPFDSEGLGGGHVSCLVGLPFDGAHQPMIKKWDQFLGRAVNPFRVDEGGSEVLFGPGYLHPFAIGSMA